MRKMTIAIGSVALALALSGCGSNKLMNRDRPDEFAVSRQAPLVIPPDFALVPPVPGATPTVTVESNRAAIQALFGGTALRSPGESSTLNAAGRDNAAPGIRSTAGDPGTNVVEKGTAVSTIIGAGESDGPTGRATTGN
jgi:Protein of unknown function (DUF3035)